MKKLAYSITGLILAASAAHAQPADVPASDHAAPHIVRKRQVEDIGRGSGGTGRINHGRGHRTHHFN